MVKNEFDRLLQGLLHLVMTDGLGATAEYIDECIMAMGVSPD
jgi:hypothetical protein